MALFLFDVSQVRSIAGRGRSRTWRDGRRHPDGSPTAALCCAGVTSFSASAEAFTRYRLEHPATCGCSICDNPLHLQRIYSGAPLQVVRARMLGNSHPRTRAGGCAVTSSTIRTFLATVQPNSGLHILY